MIDEPAWRGEAGAVQRLHPLASPRYRLFLFHHAGGSPSGFRPWARMFPPDWEICAIGLPGRGRLSQLAPITDQRAAVRFLADELSPWTGLPYGFFGHSMGGLLAFELTRSLLAAGQPTPSWLGISACKPPAAQLRDNPAPRPALSDAELRRWLTEYGAAPDPLLADESTWQLFRPMFQADFALVDSWRPQPLPAPVPVPVTTFGGRADPLVSPEELGWWAGHTERFLGVQLYPGGHFYLTSQPREVARKIVLSILFAHNRERGRDSAARPAS